MNIGGVTSSGLANSVWTNATRTLTAVPPGPLTQEGATVSNVTAAVAGTLGAYLQIVASTANAVVGIVISVNPDLANSINLRAVVSTGAAGLEVVKMTVRAAAFLGIGGRFVIPIDATVIPAGVRVATAVSNETNAAQVTVEVGVTLLER